MATNDARPTTAARPVTDSERFGTDDRYCRYCREIALAFDPAAGRPRCRTCGELA